MKHYNDLSFLGAEAPNVDRETGIRVGFISVHSVAGEALDELTSGDDLNFIEAVKEAKSRIAEALRPVLDDLGVLPFGLSSEREKLSNKYLAEVADGVWDGIEQEFNDHCESDNAAYQYEKDGYVIQYETGSALATVAVVRSPFYTCAAFGSPCIPNAGDLDTEKAEADGGIKAYALGHDWFDGGKAPYTVYDVATGGEVAPE